MHACLWKIIPRSHLSSQHFKKELSPTPKPLFPIPSHHTLKAFLPNTNTRRIGIYFSNIVYCVLFIFVEMVESKDGGEQDMESRHWWRVGCGEGARGE